MHNEHLWKVIQNHKDAFEKCETLSDFVEETKEKSLENFVGGWADRLYKTYKHHGHLSGPIVRSLFMPEVKRLEEIVYDVRYLPLPPNGSYASEAKSAVDNRIFVTATRAKGVPFGYVGAKYDWSPEWLVRGEKIGRVSNGKRYGTYARLKSEAIEQWEKHIANQNAISSIELTDWDNGKTLVCIRHENSLLGMWLALVDSSQTMFDLLPEDEKDLVRLDEKAQEELK